MAAHWERYLEQWIGEGLIDRSTAERIHAFQALHKEKLGLRWPVLLAISLGGLMLGAGVLLFVAAHWGKVSPSERFGLVLAFVAVFHLGAALVAERFSALSTTLHAVGTICLGAGIFLAGQIFNLQEHWPGGILLWAIGALGAWAILRDWPQAALLSLLAPLWLSGEWIEATYGWVVSGKILAQGLLLLSISYLTGLFPGKETPRRKALMWIGGLTAIPFAAVVPLAYVPMTGQRPPMPGSYRVTAWIIALALPLGVAWWLRHKAAWMNVIAALWVVVLGTTRLPYEAGGSLLGYVWQEFGPYAMWALGSLGLIAWGLHETRKERVNLGIAGFALTVLAFYFSTVMDKLGRAASLIGLGLLFVLGGWLIEKARRSLVVRLEKGQA